MTALRPTRTERIKLWLVGTGWLPAWLHLRWQPSNGTPALRCPLTDVQLAWFAPFNAAEPAKKQYRTAMDGPRPGSHLDPNNPNAITALTDPNRFRNAVDDLGLEGDGIDADAQDCPAGGA